MKRFVKTSTGMQAFDEAVSECLGQGGFFEQPVAFADEELHRGKARPDAFRYAREAVWKIHGVNVRVFFDTEAGTR